ncbi:hypothetical protein GGX14DRAFT_633291 [Mycena pura]|uniref:Uncharacterized protein n=1 Tax=Mycena pura TaxID=153505 RepID=A0AAD6VFQ3_9AGAR|nr:hypothetical protein GGX14DRAFT_633291 [Mycena pura]
MAHPFGRELIYATATGPQQPPIVIRSRHGPELEAPWHYHRAARPCHTRALPPVSRRLEDEWQNTPAVNRSSVLDVSIGLDLSIVYNGLHVDAASDDAESDPRRRNSTFSSCSSATLRERSHSLSASSESTACGSPEPLYYQAASPLIPDLAIDLDPGERAYRHYREKLRTTTDLAQPVSALLLSGVAGYEFAHHIALLAARLAPHAPCGAEAFIVRLRAAALGMFDAHWHGDDGPWRHEPRGACEYLTSHGVNLASLMGSLFRYGVLRARDVHHCVRALLHAPGFRQLQALHALVVHCGPDLCSRDARATAEEILRAIRATSADGRLLWGPHEESAVLVADLSATLDAWVAGDEMRAIHERAAAFTAPSATARDWKHAHGH